MHRFPIWTFPVVAVVFIVLWQWATVTSNYGGNWTALFCSGALRPRPALPSERIYVFPKSTGYDGQFYHYIAHDPFLRSNLKSFIDDPRLRYRRILVPFLAYGLALGDSRFIDPAYDAVCLLSIALGVYWSSRVAQNAGLAAAWGLLFLALPAVPITIDRLVVDGGLAALTAAFLYYSRSSSWKLFCVLACAALTRETGFLLVLAYLACLAWQRAFRTAAIFSSSAVPALAWYAYVQANTSASPYVTSPVPFSAILGAVMHPARYPAGTPFLGVVRIADYLAVAGLLLAFGFAFLWFVRGPRDPLRIAAALFAVLGLALQRPDLWQNVYNFGRLYTPLLLLLAGVAALVRTPWLLLPVAMMSPRIAIQLAPQALGVLRSI
jgi:hypothetical protein